MASSGVKATLIQRVREHKSGLGRRRVGEKSVREDSVCVSAGGVGEMEEELKTCRQFQMVKKKVVRTMTWVFSLLR